MKINLLVRLKNPVFWTQLIMSIAVPVLAYANLTPQDLTTWSAVFDVVTGAVTNPYICAVVVLAIWNAINDPTTKGLSDSTDALNYSEPKMISNEDLNKGL